MKNLTMDIKFNGTAAAEGFPGLFCECEHCQRARVLGGAKIFVHGHLV